MPQNLVIHQDKIELVDYYEDTYHINEYMTDSHHSILKVTTILYERFNSSLHKP